MNKYTKFLQHDCTGSVSSAETKIKERIRISMLHRLTLALGQLTRKLKSCNNVKEVYKTYKYINQITVKGSPTML